MNDSNRSAPSQPALILCPEETGSLRVAALTLLDRLVVTLQRAGCAPIRIVCAGVRPPLKRATALGILPEFLREAPVVDQPTLLAECALLAQPADVRRVIEQGGRLVTSTGEALPLGLVREFAGDVPASLKSLPRVPVRGVAASVRDETSAHAAADLLWNSLSSDTDGLVDKYFNRPLGRQLSKVLVRTPVTPNQVTLASTVLGLAGACAFTQGSYYPALAGALLLQLSALVDCVDGEVARIAFKESPLGKTLDFACDQIVHVALFIAIAVGAMHRGLDMPALALGLSAVAGALIAIPIVIRGRRVAGRTSDRRLDRFIDQASTRDFTALLIALAVFDRVHWFLWLTGVTVHVFWVVALLLQLPRRGSAASATGA